MSDEQKTGEELMSDVTTMVRQAHERWQDDEAFVAWIMRSSGYSREEVLGLRCGILDTHAGWVAGREHGRAESAAYLESMIDDATQPVCAVLRGLASVLVTPGIHLPQPGDPSVTWFRSR